MQRCQRRGVAVPPPISHQTRPILHSPPPHKGVDGGHGSFTDAERPTMRRKFQRNPLSPSLSLLPLISAGSAPLPPPSSRFRNTRMAADIFAFRGEGVDDALDELTLSKRGREKWRVSTKRFIVFIFWKESSC